MPKAAHQGEGRLAVWCQPCDNPHTVRIAPAKDPWTWNESLEKPTFSPSLLVTYPGGRIFNGVDYPKFVCHSYITDGKIRYLDDCTHDLKGQVVELTDWPYPEN